MSEDLSRMPTRRRFLGVSGAALAAAAMVPLANAQQVRSEDHSQPNEEQPGENNNGARCRESQLGVVAGDG